MAEKKQTKRRRRIQAAPKDCYFCKEKKTPDYSDVSTLQKFISDRAKILSRSRSGICTKHQRRLTSAIKHARHLALLPFVGGE